MFAHMLMREAQSVESDVRVGDACEIWAHSTAELRHGCAEQAQRTSHVVRLCGPGGPGTCTMGRGSKHGWKRGFKQQSHKQPCKAIPGEGAAADGASLGVLSKEAPEKHEFPPQEVGT